MQSNKMSRLKTLNMRVRWGRRRSSACKNNTRWKYRTTLSVSWI